MDKLDKVKGMLYGVWIGDAMGMVAESLTAEEIQEKIGKITTFTAPTVHKWHKNKKAGDTTDDWQLTLAVANSIIQHGLCMDGMAKKHIESMSISTDGWGPATKRAIEKLSQGSHWNQSGEAMGCGNGVAMKIAPLAVIDAYAADKWLDVAGFAINLGYMTHANVLGTSGGLSQMLAVSYCLKKTVATFSPNVFIQQLIKGYEFAKVAVTEVMATDNIRARYEELKNYKKYNTKKIIETFGGGTGYCYNSLPFTYMFFLKNYKSFNVVIDVINAGGDTDTNASMAGALLGALHGSKIFPPDLLAKINDNVHLTIEYIATRLLEKTEGIKCQT